MIFIDRSIPKSVASALKLVRDDVKWLEDEFAHDTRDTDWLPSVGAKGWLVISRDNKIRSRPGERRAIQQSNLGCFIIAVKRNLTRWEYLKLLAKNLDEMVEVFNSTAKPFIWTVETRGLSKRVL